MAWSYEITERSEAQNNLNRIVTQFAYWDELAVPPVSPDQPIRHKVLVDVLDTDTLAEVRAKCEASVRTYLGLP